MALNIHCAAAGLPLGAAFEALESVERHAVAVRLYARLLTQLADANRDADAYERQLLYQGIQCIRVGRFRRALLLARQACAPESERRAIPSPKKHVQIRHDDRPLAVLLGEVEPGRCFDWNFPADDVTYGVVVKATTPDHRIRDIGTALRNAAAHRVVLASVLPHDVRQRQDWPALWQSLQGFPRDLEVRLVREADLQHVCDWIVLVTP